MQQVRAQTRVVRSKKSQIQNIDRQRKAAVARRSGAEGALSSYIKQMTELARIKAEQQATVDLNGQSEAFSWPTTGRISQPYGCTGVKFNAARGNCKHFHDGIDVVSAYGTPVRAVAVGVVAYSGWNPYDKEGRAYVVDIVHPDGFVSRYGHLIATNHVRAGELVHTGQVIGKMGSTGKSTGTHLHFELLKGGKDVNPVSYLPTGVVRVDKTTTKAGQASKARAVRAAKATPTPKPTPRPKPSRTLNTPRSRGMSTRPSSCAPTPSPTRPAIPRSCWLGSASRATARPASRGRTARPRRRLPSGHCRVAPEGDAPRIRVRGYIDPIVS